LDEKGRYLASIEVRTHINTITK